MSRCLAAVLAMLTLLVAPVAALAHALDPVIVDVTLSAAPSASRFALGTSPCLGEDVCGAAPIQAPPQTGGDVREADRGGALGTSPCLGEDACGSAADQTPPQTGGDVREADRGGTFLLELGWSRSLAAEARLDGDRRDARPELPAACHAIGEPSARQDGVLWVWRWQAHCTREAIGAALGLGRIAPPGNDVLVRLRDPDSGEVVRTSRSDGAVELPDPSEPLSAQAAGEGAVETFVDYVQLGVVHILEGVDHLLFVLCLVLLVSGLRRLLWTLTAFTLAHSLTLGLSVLDLVRLPGPPVEAVIALSIVALAAELVRQPRDEATLTRRRPARVAFVFGLLHGLGFAGALAEVGVPAGQVPAALGGFNVGVELGQVAFVLAVTAVLWLVRRGLPATWQRPAMLAGTRSVAVYAVGITAGYWLVERVLGFGS